MSLTRAARFTAGLVFAHLLTSAEVVIVLVSLGSQNRTAAESLLPKADLGALLVVVLAGTVLAAIGGYRIIAPSLRWFDAGVEPDARQRRATINIIRRQSVLLMAIWLLSGTIFIITNGVTGWIPVLLIEVSVLFGGISTASSSLLFTQRVTRPLVAAASRDFEGRVTAPGVQARLLLMWTLTTALPSLTIALMVVFRANGWLIPQTASVDVPVVLLSLVSVFLGLRTLMLVSISISDPRTTVLPVASACPILWMATSKGKFHGTIAPTTPTASRHTIRVVFAPVTETSASPSEVSHGYSSISFAG